MPHVNLALLGLLGLIQVVFLPGYLLLRVLRSAAGPSLRPCSLFRPQPVGQLSARGWPCRLGAVSPRHNLRDLRRRAGTLAAGWTTGGWPCRLAKCWPPCESGRWPSSATLIAPARSDRAGCGGRCSPRRCRSSPASPWPASPKPARSSSNGTPLSPGTAGPSSGPPTSCPASDELLSAIAAGEHLAQLRIHANEPGLDFRQSRAVPLLLLAPAGDARCGAAAGQLRPRTRGSQSRTGSFVALLRYRMLSSGYADVPLAFFAWMPIYAPL